MKKQTLISGGTVEGLYSDTVIGNITEKGATV